MQLPARCIVELSLTCRLLATGGLLSMFHVFVDGQAYGPFNKVRAFVRQSACVQRSHERCCGVLQIRCSPLLVEGAQQSLKFRTFFPVGNQV